MTYSSCWNVETQRGMYYCHTGSPPRSAVQAEYIVTSTVGCAEWNCAQGQSTATLPHLVHTVMIGKVPEIHTATVRPIMSHAFSTQNQSGTANVMHSKCLPTGAKQTQSTADLHPARQCCLLQACE